MKQLMNIIKGIYQNTVYARSEMSIPTRSTVSASGFPKHGASNHDKTYMTIHCYKCSHSLDFENGKRFYVMKSAPIARCHCAVAKCVIL